MQRCNMDDSLAQGDLLSVRELVIGAVLPLFYAI
jgi:hypothetical protein